MIFSRYCELLCCCCFPASSACKTTDKIVISLVLRRQMNYGVGQILTKKTSASWRRHSRFFYHLQGKPFGFLFCFWWLFSCPPFKILLFYSDFNAFAITNQADASRSPSCNEQTFLWHQGNLQLVEEQILPLPTPLRGLVHTWLKLP